MQAIRTAARALIIQNENLLTIKMKDANGIFYILPGGGQNHGETLKKSLEREVFEEVGAEISVGKLAYVREYIGKNHGFRKSHHSFHQLESVFFCSLKSSPEIEKAHNPDNKQIGVEWIPIAKISDYKILPEILNSFIQDIHLKENDLYLGDIN